MDGGDRAELLAGLRRQVRGGVDDSVRRRAEYSTDASNYRVVPEVVVFPLDVDDALAAVEVARQSGVPLTARGGGTSVAGNAIGTGVVLDFSRHLNRIITLEPGSATVTVEPGVVLSDLQRAAAVHRLRFGPDPSTRTRATLGGMIGNDACGPHAVAYGRTADNVRSLDVVDGSGRRFEAGRGLDPIPGLAELVGGTLGVLRTELGRFSRQGSGYPLDRLLPEHHADLAKALVGTEGTVVTVLGATLDLVPVVAATALVVLGYPDLAAAADAVPDLMLHNPLAVEGLDAALVEVVRARRGRVPDLPAGGGWLMVETGGSTEGEALAAARALAARAGPAPGAIVTGAQAAALWRIREDGAGLAGRTAANAAAWPGWEDAAVPPDRLGDYLRGFAALMHATGVHGMTYGHFGDGCVHVRLDLPLAADGTRLRDFVTAAAELVVAHGGSLSGEHGDGRARSELLPVMYSPAAMAAFAAFKALLDPSDLLNPGVLVRPRPVDADLRRPLAPPIPLLRSSFRLVDDGGDLTTAVHRCVGVGRCRVDTPTERGFMCPSFVATRDEKDSTRGRARVLQEMANGSLVTGGPRAPEVAEALDLCLSCKACTSDCPAEVDMARYKSEVLYRAYRRRVRPATHYVLGRLPMWARTASRAPAPINAAMQWRPMTTVLKRLAGIDPRRPLPRFARSFRSGGAVPTSPGGRPVLLWVDTFTDAFDPAVARAAVRVLSSAGFAVRVPERAACCGLTWISTGQLDGARRRLRRLLDVLGPPAMSGIPIVGLEPSCTAVLRGDLPDLFPDDQRSAAVAGATVTLAELLETVPEWQPSPLAGTTLVVQPHCHQHAVLGFDADRRLLERTGADVTELTGCCGLAGNFGMELGHYDISVAVAEAALLPALRSAPDGAILVADGFSCRTQAAHLAAVRGRHLAELLSGDLPGQEPS